MPRTTFRQSDVTRAIRAAQAVGLPVVGFEIAPDGRIVVLTATEGHDAADAALDGWQRGRANAR